MVPTRSLDGPQVNCFAVIDDNRHNVVAKYKFVKRIGSGSFGEVWLGYEIHTKENVAIKVESSKTKVPQLQREYSIYTRYLQGVNGFPMVKHFASAKSCTYFVMTLLGDSLQKLLTQCGGQFSLKTVLMIAIQVLERLEELHTRSGFLTRDVKPDNLLMGRAHSRFANILYMVDLGLAKQFMDVNTGHHIEGRKLRRSLTGTARYASVNAHDGADQSRRDDLESAGYVFIYLYRGKLPWQGIRASTKKKKYEKIRDMKSSMPTFELCDGLPAEFALYLDYCRSLGFKEEPDYAHLRGLFSGLLESKGCTFDHEYDWCKKSNSKHFRSSSSSLGTYYDREP